MKGVGFGTQFEPIGTRLLGQGFGTQKRRGSGIQIEDGKWDAKQGQKVRLPMSAGNETQTQKGNTQRIQKVNLDKWEAYNKYGKRISKKRKRITNRAPYCNT